MNALVRKEIRALLPAWLATLLLAVVPTCLYAIKARSFWSDNAFVAQQGFIILSGYCFGLGAVVLALTPFGHEFTAKTFSHLLSQPAPRQRMWVAKALPLAIATLLNLIVYLLSLWLVLNLSSSAGVGGRFLSDVLDMFRAIPIVALLAYSGGLWTTVLFRTIPGALGITIVAPLAVLMLENRIVGKIAPHYVDTLVPWVLIIYAIGGIIFARWYFLRAQDVPWEGRAISLPIGRTNFWRLISSFRRTSKYVALAHKELQLHQTSFFIAAFLLIAHLGSFVVRKFMPQSSSSEAWIIINNIWVIWFVLPLFVGSISVAEERRFAMLDGCLAQPVSRIGQFLTKFLVTIAVAIFLGTIIPWTLEHLGTLFGLKNELMAEGSFGGILTAAIVIASCAFFASTVARNPIEAICLGGVLTPIVCIAFQFLASNRDERGLVHHFGLLTFYIFNPICLSTGVYLAWKNFQCTHLRWTNLAGTFAALALSVLVACGIASFTWHRSWELLMPLEPQHGKPVLHTGDHVKITSCVGPIVLLPDGKIWMAQYKLRVRTDERKEQHVTAITLTNAQFLDSKWIDLAAGAWAFAIKADGTLWQITSAFGNRENSDGWSWRPMDSPKQFGADSDWRSIVAADSYFLALKRDGSVWGWGYNQSGELGPGSHMKTNAPVRLWNDSDWAQVFALRSMCIGIKRDGTIWSWGKQIRYANDPVPDYQPVQLPFSGTNWTSFAGPILGNPIGRCCILGTRSDGTLWGFSDGSPEDVKSSAHVFGNLYRIGPMPIQMSDRTDWLAVSGLSSLSALTQDGAWLLLDSGLPNRKRSRYSDWLAISPRYEQTGLAADGTISSWEYIDKYPYYFAGTRRPTWSTNIFATR